MSTFQENLKKELYYNDVRAKELSYRTEIPYSTILSYLNKRNCVPTVINGVKIAQALNTSVEYLVNGSYENNRNEPNNLNIIVSRLALLPKPSIRCFEQLIISLTEHLN